MPNNIKTTSQWSKPFFKLSNIQTSPNASELYLNIPESRQILRASRKSRYEPIPRLRIPNGHRQHQSPLQTKHKKFLNFQNANFLQ